MTQEEQLYNFEIYLQKRHMAKNTIQVYLFAAEQFLSMYHVPSYHTLMLYKCFLLERYKPQTINLRIRAMNCFLEHSHITDIKIPMVKVQQKTFLENVISQADYEYLKKCLTRDGNLLYYFIIRFMAATGVRVSELVQIKVEHVFQGHMDIYSKDNKIRRVFFPAALQKDALLWLKNTERTKGYLFLNRMSAPVTPAGIRGQLRKFSVLYGLNENVVYPHSFRHRFAKNFIEKCGDIALLSDLLGHESIETTRIYLHRSSTEQHQIVNQVVNW